MLLTLHIIFSLCAVTGTVMGKTKTTLALLLGSLTSGGLLVFTSHANLGRFCLSGITLTIFSLTILRVRQLSKQSVE